MRVILFAIGGVFVGLFFSIVYLGIVILTGGMPRPDGSIISPVSATIVYMGGSFIGGGLVGLFYSAFVSNNVGAALVGCLATAPLMFASSALYYGSVADVEWSIVIIGAILVGMPLGVYFRREYHGGVSTEIRD